MKLGLEQYRNCRRVAGGPSTRGLCRLAKSRAPAKEIIAAAMDTCDVVRVQCAYCLETVDVYVDPETVGEMVQDSEVCCNPWQLVVS